MSKAYMLYTLKKLSEDEWVIEDVKGIYLNKELAKVFGERLGLDRQFWDIDDVPFNDGDYQNYNPNNPNPIRVPWIYSDW